MTYETNDDCPVNRLSADADGLRGGGSSSVAKTASGISSGGSGGSGTAGGSGSGAGGSGSGSGSSAGGTGSGSGSSAGGTGSGSGSSAGGTGSGSGSSAGGSGSGSGSSAGGSGGGSGSSAGGTGSGSGSSAGGSGSGTSSLSGFDPTSCVPNCSTPPLAKGVVRLDGTKILYPNTPAGKNTADDLATVTVDGTTYTLREDSTAAGQLAYKTAYSHSVWGGQETGPDGGFSYSIGKPTVVADMPAAGSATYKGGALYIFDDDNKDPVRDNQAANISVDFGQKTVSGTLKFTTIGKTVPIAATIQGNAFQGETGTIRTTGAFYGPQAAELGGVFKDTDTHDDGSFGAKKQP